MKSEVVARCLTMVLWQLCTLEHLRTSSFGYPPPRHGLQLLFWFANDCVTSDSHITMKVRNRLLSTTVFMKNVKMFRETAFPAWTEEMVPPEEKTVM